MTSTLEAPPSVTPERSLPARWGGSVVLSGPEEPLRRFRPVLALTVRRSGPDGGSEILVGVRDPRSNSTHQNVTSVPTRRVPASLAGPWRRMIRNGSAKAGEGYVGLRDQVHALFGCKLGLADPLERGEVALRLGRVGAWQGISVIGEHPDGTPVTEELTMFNVEVVFSVGSELVPSSTASYSTLAWVDIDRFGEMVRFRDPGRLGVGLENAFACAYGLCLQTSLSMTEWAGPGQLELLA